MKKIILLALMLTPLGLCAQTRQAADAAYEAGRFQEALNYYRQEVKTAGGDALYEAQLRAVACQFMLGQYMNAAKEIFTLPLPSHPVWKARFLLYRMQTAQRVKNMYSPALPNASEDGADLSTLSPEQWKDKIDETFEQLWSLRADLINAPLEKETLILEIKDADLKAVPTLFDFVTLKWKEYLIGQSFTAVPLRAKTALTLEYPSASKTANNAQKLLDILAEAAKLGGKNRADARLIWQVQRIMLPFEYDQFFTFEDKTAERAEAARLLQTLTGYTEEKKGVLAKISRLLRTSSANYGKSYAAYTAAGLLNQNEEYAQAVALCDWAQTKLGNNYYTQSCARLAQEIRKPVLNVMAPNANQDPTNTRVNCTVRNAPEVFARLYPVTEKELKTWYNNAYSSSRHQWDYLTEIPGKEIPRLLKRTPLATLNQAVSYEKPHAFKTIEFKLPQLEQRGFYIVLLSLNRDFNSENSPLKAVVLNNTDLALFVSAAIEGDPADYRTGQNKTFDPNIFRIYALNLKTGEPEANADVTYFTDWRGRTEQGKTNENGVLSVKRKISTNFRASNHYLLMPKAVSSAGTALMTNFTFFNFYPQDPVRLFAETDRAVYRPGQKVQFAVYGFERAGRGLKTLAAGTKVSVTLRDANYEKIYNKTLPLNAYGTAQGEVTLPETGLLGNYLVEAEFKNAQRTTRANASFRVDEYKRPEYEITLSPSAALQYGKEAQIEGKALYYFGAPLEKANVKYTIHRKYFTPRWWWWMPYENAEREFIAQGETKTDKNGAFSFSFTPQNTKCKNLPSVYTVHAEVADASGRVIETTRTYKAAQKAAFFQASFDKGFYDAKTASSLAEVKLTDVNGEPTDGKFTAEIYEVKNILPEETQQTQEGRNYHDPSQSWENLYGNNKEIRKVSSHEISLKKGESAKLNIAALTEGIYKLKLRAKNADDANLIFLVTEKKSSLALPAVAVVQHEKYYPGTQAKVLIGAQALKGAKRIEVYDDGQFLALRELTGAGAGVYSLPIQNHWRGGVHLRWFGTSDYRFYSQQAFIQVPFDNKELSLQIKTPDAVKPAEKVQWELSAKNAAGAPVQGQASVRIYDKSLDYYAKPRPAFTMENLYSSPSLQASMNDSEQKNTASVYPEKEVYDISEMKEAPQMPRLNLQPHFYYYNSFRSAGGVSNYAMARGAMMKTEAPMAAKQMVMEEAAFDTDGGSMERSSESAAVLGATVDDAADETAETEVRSDFSETAYFNPTLPIQGGKSTVAFTMPQSLTAWNVMAFALTKTADFGAFEAQTLTRKDLSVRLSLPRFWREGDASVLVAQVSNLTDKKLSAEVTLDLTLDGKDAAARFGIEKTTQKVSVPAGGTAALNWPVSVPSGVGVIKAAVTVRSGKDADAEVREIPLLPAKERLAESVTAALESGRAELKLENLLTEDPTRKVSSVTLRVDPGLLLSVFNAMPQLLRPTYNDVLSVASSYVPLAVVNGFYKTYPMLQDAVAKLPKRNTRTPAWNDNSDPSRLLLLEETPWLRQARGGAQRGAFLTDLFNPSDVEKARQKAEKDLAKYQTASGGYSWMPGGKPSAYITLSLLSAYAEALRHGGQIPTGAAKKALKWLWPVIEKDLLASTGSSSSVSFALYAAYVFTAFDQTWTEVKSAPVKKWLDYADAHAQYMTPIGQTYAAAAYYRLGENTKAQNYLDLVLSQMKTNPITGAYFAPEELSWLWYNDTLRTQTATLRTLMEIRPESDKASELVKWLLFNRKAQAWDSSSATADAVYALLDYMQRKGLLDDPAEYTLQWGEKDKTLHFEPFDWSEQLSWTVQAQNVPEKYYTASAAKRGGLTGFVTLDAVYTTANAKASPKGVLNVQRQYFLKYTENGREKVRALQPQEELPAGSEVEVRLTIQADSAFDYVLLQDPKPAGFENTDLLSGWSWDILPVYRQYRDASTQFFIDHVPAGKYTLSYTLRPTLEGTYHALPAQLQSMYSPQFSAHTDAARLNVK